MCSVGAFCVVRDLKEPTDHFRKYLANFTLVKSYDTLDGLQNNPKGVTLGDGNDKTRQNRNC